MIDVRVYLFEKLADEKMYSVDEIFDVLASLTNKSFEDTDFLGFNMKEIEKIVANEYEVKRCFKHRRKGSILEFSGNCYIMNKKFIFDLLDELENNIELQKGKFYSLTAVLRRLEYPVHLDKYYFDDPWSDFDKTYIQRIVKDDYEGICVFFKSYDGWVIYGPDTKYKDMRGMHDLKSSNSEPRPKGYEKMNAGVMEYLMNWEYVKCLAYELERRKFTKKHESSLLKIESDLSNLNRAELVEFAHSFLNKNQQYYLQELKKLDIEIRGRVAQHKSNLQQISDCICYGYFDELDVLSKNVELLNSMKEFKLTYKTVLTNVKKRVDEDFLSDEECKILIAKSLYNKQNKWEKDFKEYRQRVFVAIGECAKYERNILKKLKRNLSGE